MDWKELLKAVKTVLVIDWPSKEVPETLALAAFQVVVRGGPGSNEFSIYEVDSTGGVVRRSGQAPEQAELVYAHRPLIELPSIIASAKALRARAVWIQSGRSPTGSKDPRGCWLPAEEDQWAAELAQSAGLSYFSQPYIADAIRELRTL